MKASSRTERVVVTGLGVVSAVGNSRDLFFDALAAGTSAVRPGPEATPGSAGDVVPLAARIEDIGAKRWFDPRALRRLARISQLALVAAKEALEHAGAAAAYERDRTGVVLGTGLGSL